MRKFKECMFHGLTFSVKRNICDCNFTPYGRCILQYCDTNIEPELLCSWVVASEFGSDIKSGVFISWKLRAAVVWSNFGILFKSYIIIRLSVKKSDKIIIAIVCYYFFDSKRKLHWHFDCSVDYSATLAIVYYHLGLIGWGGGIHGNPASGSH